MYAAKVASVFKKVVAELLGWVDAKVEDAKFLEKKDKGQVMDPVVGGEII